MSKKKNLVTIGVFAFISVAVFSASFYSDKNTNKLSDLALTNIEALARGEDGGGKTCTVIGYKEIWSGGCLYNCAQCAEGHFVSVSLIRCLAR